MRTLSEIFASTFSARLSVFHFLSQELYTVRNFCINFSSFLSLSANTASNSRIKIQHQSFKKTFYQDIKTVFNEYLIRIFISVFFFVISIFSGIKILNLSLANVLFLVERLHLKNNKIMFLLLPDEMTSVRVHSSQTFPFEQLCVFCAF